MNMHNYCCVSGDDRNIMPFKMKNEYSGYISENFMINVVEN